MATSYATVKCLVKWAKIYEPDVFSGAENWKINVYPVDEAEWKKFDVTGLQVTVKTDETADPYLSGKKFVTLRRPTKKLIKDELVVFSPPEITGKITVRYTDTEGEKVRQYNKSDKTVVTRVNQDGEEIKGKITLDENSEYVLPNGSLVLVNFCYYDTVKGKGHRLEGIRVLELAEIGDRIVDKSEVKEDLEVKPERKVTKQKDLPSHAPIGENIDDILNDLPW